MLCVLAAKAQSQCLGSPSKRSGKGMQMQPDVRKWGFPKAFALGASVVTPWHGPELPLQWGWCKPVDNEPSCALSSGNTCSVLSWVTPGLILYQWLFLLHLALQREIWASPVHPNIETTPHRSTESAQGCYAGGWSAAAGWAQ